MIYHLQQLTKRSLQLGVCSLHRVELGLRALVKHTTGGTISNKLFGGEIGELLDQNVWTRPIKKVFSQQYAFTYCIHR